MRPPKKPTIDRNDAQQSNLVHAATELAINGEELIGLLNAGHHSIPAQFRDYNGPHPFTDIEVDYLIQGPEHLVLRLWGHQNRPLVEAHCDQLAAVLRQFKKRHSDTSFVVQLLANVYRRDSDTTETTAILLEVRGLRLDMGEEAVRWFLTQLSK